MSFGIKFAVAATALAVVVGAPPALAAKPVKCRSGCTTSTADTTPPTVGISSPAAGSTVSGTVTVSGTAADNVGVARVDVAVDGGSWMTASGTTSWSLGLSTTTYADGSHTISARATDTSGNTSTTSETVTTSNTTATTTSPSPSPSPSPTTSPSPAATTSTSTTAPDTQGTWTSPEGVTISVNTTDTVWTIRRVYSILTANAMDLSLVGPDLTINLQDSTGNFTSTSAGGSGGQYYGYQATMSLRAGGQLDSIPDATIAHEYGHAWSYYWYYLKNGGSWSSYENARWTTADGSLTLATDSRTGSSYTWQVSEIIADDYRLLFGSSLAVSERPTHLNTSIPMPGDVPGLQTFLASTWRG